MNKPIPDSLHLKLSFTEIPRSVTNPRKGALVVNPTRFTKPGESQADAIKRLMRSRKSAAKAQPKRVFPRSSDALKSTKSYVAEYYRRNDLLTTVKGPLDKLFVLSEAPTTWLEGPEVTAEDDPDYCPFL